MEERGLRGGCDGANSGKLVSSSPLDCAEACVICFEGGDNGGSGKLVSSKPLANEPEEMASEGSMVAGEIGFNVGLSSDGTTGLSTVAVSGGGRVAAAFAADVCSSACAANGREGGSGGTVVSSIA